MILRGGSDAINSNKAIVQVIKAGLRKARLSQDLILLVEDTSRAVATEMMRLHEYIDAVSYTHLVFLAAMKTDWQPAILWNIQDTLTEQDLVRWRRLKGAGWILRRI